MLNPLQVKHGVGFFPIGTEPPVDLLQYQLRRLENTEDTSLSATKNDHTVRILLLACGNPRSILLSIWNRYADVSYNVGTIKVL